MTNIAEEEKRDPYIDRFRNSPVSEVTREVVDQAFRAYKTARCLSLIAFFVGIGLIAAAVVFSFLRSDSELLSLILGGLGTVNLVALLLYRPIERIQLGVDKLVQSQIVWLTFQAQYDFVARALATMSKMRFDDEHRGWDKEEGLIHELKLAKHLGEFASELIGDLGGQVSGASATKTGGESQGKIASQE